MKGSSAIQIVAALQPKVGHIVNFARGQTWVAPPFAWDTLVKSIGRDSAADGPDDSKSTDCVSLDMPREDLAHFDAVLFTHEEIERFKNNPKLARDFRCTVEGDFNVCSPFRLWLLPIGYAECMLISGQSVHACTIRGTSQSSEFTESLLKSMRRKLAKKPWIAEHCAST